MSLMIYPVIVMPGKYSGLRALPWHFNSYYESLDISIYFRYPTGYRNNERVLYLEEYKESVG
jgi:hypothetical protein